MTVMNQSRAVTRMVEAGTRIPCASEECDQLITYKARNKFEQVICNVYEDGVWKRTEHFHTRCYDGRYGDAGQAPLRSGR